MPSHNFGKILYLKHDALTIPSVIFEWQAVIIEIGVLYLYKMFYSPHNMFLYFTSLPRGGVHVFQWEVYL